LLVARLITLGFAGCANLSGKKLPLSYVLPRADSVITDGIAIIRGAQNEAEARQFTSS